LGICSDYVRLPLVKATEGYTTTLAAVLAQTLQGLEKTTRPQVAAR